MRRTFWIHCVIALLTANLWAEQTSAPVATPDFDKLIEQLKSDDFEIREEATVQLGEHASLYWDKLKKENRDSIDPEVRLRVQKAMQAPAQKMLQATIQTTTKELEKIAENKKPSDEDILQKNKLRTLISQCKYASQNPEILEFLGKNPPSQFDPKALPLSFTARRAIPVSFDFVDQPLDKALSQLSDMTGLKIELKSKVESPISLRAQDMESDIALQWILRAAECNYRIDKENNKIIIVSSADENNVELNPNLKP